VAGKALHTMLLFICGCGCYSCVVVVNGRLWRGDSEPYGGILDSADDDLDSTNAMENSS